MVEKLKVLLISSGVLPVPCPGYGGLEMIVADLAICLDRMGHDVSVVAPSESTIGKIGKIKLIDCGPCNENAHQWELDAFNKYKDSLAGYDIIHDHSWRKFAYIAKLENKKLNVCSTLHGMLPYQSPPPLERPNMIGISKRHADSISAGLGIPCRFNYNGIDLDKYKTGDVKRNNRWLFLARITPFKGPHVFIDAVNQIGGDGDVVGDDTMVENRGYVERVLMACNAAQGRIRYWGGVPRDMAVELFQKSKCYILPCTPGWEEPFGLTIIESMACGCPVIGTPSGSMPELIENGVSGYIARSLQDLPVLMTDENIKKITPGNCRKQAEKFSRERMTEGYLSLYKEMLEHGGW
jgi:glycosyltransferase involved in cell wall biosynthesis